MRKAYNPIMGLPVVFFYRKVSLDRTHQDLKLCLRTLEQIFQHISLFDFLYLVKIS